MIPHLKILRIVGSSIIDNTLVLHCKRKTGRDFLQIYDYVFIYFFSMVI